MPRTPAVAFGTWGWFWGAITRSRVEAIVNRMVDAWPRQTSGPHPPGNEVVDLRKVGQQDPVKGPGRAVGHGFALRSCDATKPRWRKARCIERPRKDSVPLATGLCSLIAMHTMRHDLNHVGGRSLSSRCRSMQRAFRRLSFVGQSLGPSPPARRNLHFLPLPPPLLFSNRQRSWRTLPRARIVCSTRGLRRRVAPLVHPLRWRTRGRVRNSCPGGVARIAPFAPQRRHF